MLIRDLKEAVDMPTDVALQVVPQPLPDELVGFFLTAEAVQGQALHRQSFWNSKTGLRSGKTFFSDSDNDAQQMKKIDSNHFKTFNESSLIQRRRLRRHRYFFGYCCPSEKYGWWNFQAWAEPSFWFRKIDSDEILIDNVFREMVLRNKENFDEYCFRQQVLFFFAQIWNILTIFPSKTLQNFAEIRT